LAGSIRRRAAEVARARHTLECDDEILVYVIVFFSSSAVLVGVYNGADVTVKPGAVAGPAGSMGAVVAGRGHPLAWRSPARIGVIDGIKIGSPTVSFASR